MESIFIYAILVTSVYFVFKVIEMKYLEEELKPLKEIVRDLSMVLSSSSIAAFFMSYFQKYIHDFFNVMTKTKVLNNDQAQVFTGEPGF